MQFYLVGPQQGFITLLQYFTTENGKISNHSERLTYFCIEKLAI